MLSLMYDKTIPGFRLCSARVSLYSSAGATRRYNPLRMVVRMRIISIAALAVIALLTVFAMAQTSPEKSQGARLEELEKKVLQLELEVRALRDRMKPRVLPLRP